MPAKGRRFDVWTVQWRQAIHKLLTNPPSIYRTPLGLVGKGVHDNVTQPATQTRDVATCRLEQPM